MKNCIILIFLSFPILLFCQEQKKYQHEIGINLVPPIAYLSNSSLNNGLDIEAFYKLNNTETLNTWRAKFRKTLELNPRSHSDRAIPVNQQCIIYNSYDKTGFLQIDIGYQEAVMLKSGLIFYMGTDLNLGIYKSLLEVETYFCSDDINPLPSDIRSDFEEFYLGVTPVAGFVMPVGKKINITLELGTMLAANFEKMPYYNAEGNLVIEKQGAKLLTTWQESFLLNDIGISYKF